MDSAGFLAHLRSDLGAFEACLTGDLSAPIAACGDWTLRDLAVHLGSGNVWSATAVTEGRGDHRPSDAPQDQAGLVKWFNGTATTLLDALDRDPSDPAWTFWPPRTAGFWQRRRAQETLIHRWDAQHALGIDRPLDAALADDGVAEVFDTMAPRQIDRGRAHPPAYAVRLETTDTGSSWTYGSGDPVATVSAPAETLLLMLWGRVAVDDESIGWAGDRSAGQAALGGQLVP